LIYKDFPSTWLHTPMCPGKSSVPLYVPYIEERIYYINPLDSPTKTVSIVENPEFIRLTDCEKKLFNYDLRWRGGVTQTSPWFLNLKRKPKLELQIVNYAGSVYLPKGEWEMSLVLADIYGNEQAVHFTVFVVDDSVNY
jgi:hypothetical protein